MERLRLGFALTGSFCTWAKIMPVLEQLAQIYDVYPILSPIGFASNNRFGRASDWQMQIEKICGRPIWHTIEQVEPIGPKNLLDALAVVPCTGNTLAKLASGLSDNCTTMSVKSTLRNQHPVVLAVSTNDALGASARNIGTLMNAKNIYFVPMSQDDPHGKPASMVAHFDLVADTIAAALTGKQLQPLMLASPSPQA